MTAIAGRPIGAEHPPFVIAEMSGNHNGSLDRALALVDAIADAGAHAVKFQTYTADTLTIDSDEDAFVISDDHPLWAKRTLHDLYREAHTPWDWHPILFARARERGLVAFSSPFDPTAVDLLESLDVPAYKIASSEIVDLPLVDLVARTGRPVVLSTGMASLAEIDAAVRTVRATGNDDVVVLACTASYPAPVGDANLRRIPALGDVLGAPIGLSDHTPGIGAAVAAVALGAVAVEKHVTLDRDDGGVDSAFSLTPVELAALVTETHRAHAALGSPRIEPARSEAEGLRFRRSLFVVADVEAGEPVTVGNVRSIRPAGGLSPALLPTVVGRTFARAVRRGTPLTWDVL